MCYVGKMYNCLIFNINGGKAALFQSIFPEKYLCSTKKQGDVVLENQFLGKWILGGKSSDYKRTGTGGAAFDVPNGK